MNDLQKALDGTHDDLESYLQNVMVEDFKLHLKEYQSKDIKLFKLELIEMINNLT